MYLYNKYPYIKFSVYSHVLLLKKKIGFFSKQNIKNGISILLVCNTFFPSSSCNSAIIAQFGEIEILLG